MLPTLEHNFFLLYELFHLKKKYFNFCVFDEPKHQIVFHHRHY